MPQTQAKFEIECSGVRKGGIKLSIRPAAGSEGKPISLIDVARPGRRGRKPKRLSYPQMLEVARIAITEELSSLDEDGSGQASGNGHAKAFTKRNATRLHGPQWPG